MARRIIRLGSSDLTALDQFCGAGGTSLGARKAGVHVRVAINHNPIAIETHRLNHPETAHDCADISKCHPSRYVRTTFLLTSPSCTHHTTAAGSRRKQRRQLELEFGDRAVHEDDIGDRSRATMWDVPKFVEHFGYEGVILENVTDLVFWPAFDSWLGAMRAYGYEHELVSFNAMFAPPTGQARNRLYIVFWRRGNPKPNLDLSPMAPCARCGHDVRARQTWLWSKAYGRLNTTGEYARYGRRKQYLYACPQCGEEVLPYHYGAIHAIDTALPAPTLAEREEAGDGVAESIRIRLQKEIDRWGFVPMLVTTNCTTHNGRVRTLFEPAFTLTCSNTTAVALPPEAPATGRPAGAWSLDVRSPSSLLLPGYEAVAEQLRRGAERMRSMDEYRYRSLTPTERLVLMGFPRDYRLAGTVTEQNQMIGNGNPPEVCRMLVERLAASLAPECYPEEIRPLAA